MRSGETVPSSVPIPSPGSAARSELGLCGVVARLLTLATAGTEPFPESDGDVELETAAFPEAASPPETAVELTVGLIAWLATHGAWKAGEAGQAEVVVASAASGWLCPPVDAP
jgi:hypothetical protein